MQFVEDDDCANARWVLETARIRAMARRQLSFSVPIVLAGVFVGFDVQCRSNRPGAAE